MDGRNEELSEGEPHYWPSRSPTGRQIVSATNRHGQFDLYVMNAAAALKGGHAQHREQQN